MKFYDKQSKRPMWTSFPQLFYPIIKFPIADKSSDYGFRICCIDKVAELSLIRDLILIIQLQIL